MIASRFLAKTTFDSYEDFIRNYYLQYPDNFNFATHVVDAYALEEPERRALVWCDDEGRERIFTFRDISDISKRTAAYLRKIGIGKGDRVMMILKRRWEYWTTVVALHRIGAIAIPASFQLRDSDIAYRVNAANVKLLIAADDDFIISQVELARPQCPCLEKIALIRKRRDGWLEFTRGVENTKEEFTVDDSITFDDHMLIYFTSGTDGYPKMVVHSYTYPLGHIVTAGYWQCVVDGGLHFTGVDSGWAKFGWGLIYGQWLCGSAVLGYDADNKFNPRNLINVIKKYRPTTVCVPGTIYRFLMREGLTHEDFASVRHCCTAGEPLTPAIIEDFKNITGLDIYEGYGQSESSVLVANFPWFAPRAGSMGRPSPLYNIVLQDERGRICPPGVEGEIVVRSLQYGLPEGLIQGYFRDGQVFNAYGDSFVYHTGDLAYRDEDGYFWFVGRTDDVIKCSAYRIGPFEIESVLYKHPAVLECAITGAPDEIRGQVVKASIVLAPGYAPSPALTKELQDYVKQHTAPYKYPRIVDYVDSLPKTTSGKIIRKKIRLSDDEKRS
ncbi:MAG: AMP-binding protein [Oscillospiraceae bacterium]|nr:AMP-binding protein [Oscillospiraceae bacterium]